MTVIRNVTTGEVVATRATVASTPWARIVGLLATPALADGEALVIPRCRSIHTCFMRFPIDVVFLGAAGEIVRTVPDVRPFRMVWSREADTVLELPAGTLRQGTLNPGQLVHVEGVIG